MPKVLGVDRLRKDALAELAATWKELEDDEYQGREATNFLGTLLRDEPEALEEGGTLAAIEDELRQVLQGRIRKEIEDLRTDLLPSPGADRLANPAPARLERHTIRPDDLKHELVKLDERLERIRTLARAAYAPQDLAGRPPKNAKRDAEIVREFDTQGRAWTEIAEERSMTPLAAQQAYKRVKEREAGQIRKLTERVREIRRVLAE